MGFLNGLGGGSSPQGYNIQKPVTSEEAMAAHTQSVDAIKQQQAFLTALQGQNGIQNQSNIFGQQQALAGQLQNVANGTGPNPALAQLNQATGQNVANQAALMAGQRGAGANAGMLARQAGQQGGALQQQAVGQGATLQAQQQLAGMQALQNQQGMLGNLATQQVGQQSGATGALNQYSQAEQQQLLSAINNQNQAGIQNVSQQNQAQGQKNQQGLGAIFGGGGSLLGLAGGLGGAVSTIGSLFGGGGGGSSPSTQGSGGMLGNNYQLMAAGGAVSKAGQYLMNPQSYASGGYVNAMVSPGERYLPPSEVEQVEQGKKPALKAGEKIHGKAKVKGDSLKNDTVPKKLKEGGIVLPKSVTEHPNAPDEAKRFVIAILAKKGLKK